MLTFIGSPQKALLALDEARHLCLRRRNGSPLPETNRQVSTLAQSRTFAVPSKYS